MSHSWSRAGGGAEEVVARTSRFRVAPQPQTAVSTSSSEGRSIRRKPAEDESDQRPYAMFTNRRFTSTQQSPPV